MSTLDDVKSGIQMGPPGYVNPFTLAVNTDYFKVGGKAASVFMLSEAVDNKAPGVRDRTPYPSFPYLGHTRSSVFESNGSGNPKPLIEIEDSNNPAFTIINTPQNARYGAAMTTVLRDTDNLWHFTDRGTYCHAHTGHTALANLRPHSTMAWM
jgi:hypothetical protein